MSASQAVSIAKAIGGLSISAFLSISYAMAFAYTNPLLVYGAMAASFILLSAPVWLGFLGRTVRRWLLYYLLVAVILCLGIVARFVIEGVALPV